MATKIYLFRDYNPDHPRKPGYRGPDSKIVTGAEEQAYLAEQAGYECDSVEVFLARRGEKDFFAGAKCARNADVKFLAQWLGQCGTVEEAFDRIDAVAGRKQSLLATATKIQQRLLALLG